MVVWAGQRNFGSWWLRVGCRAIASLMRESLCRTKCFPVDHCNYLSLGQLTVNTSILGNNNVCRQLRWRPWLLCSDQATFFFTPCRPICKLHFQAIMYSTLAAEAVDEHKKTTCVQNTDNMPWAETDFPNRAVKFFQLWLDCKLIHGILVYWPLICFHKYDIFMQTSEQWQQNLSMQLF